ncbi:hypothetical protein D2T31_12130 [Sinirhodobacter populi]|uniref:Uncharacterized protein n=1 Tax=Paenirhodobacter populi TaxID=2306993 RepID=A0A443K844_9RHOB|nr:hypothetical protein [Sinirhodobacter populi]RWR28853.1 hypothetical protein D2T31_12130 [Sinirhodobacter populi]
MKRRDLLTAALAAPLAAVPAVAVAETAETPVMALFREWASYWTWLNSPATREMDEDDFSKLTDHADDLTMRIAKTAAKNTRDLVAKFVALSDYGEMGLPDPEKTPELWAEARALIEQAA